MVAAWSTVMVFVLKRFDYIHTGYHKETIDIFIKRHLLTGQAIKDDFKLLHSDILTTSTG